MLPERERLAPGRPDVLQQGAVRVAITRYHIDIDAAHFVPYEGGDPRTHALFPAGFMPSFGSGLAFKGVGAGGELEFYGLTDRGPNGDAPMVPAPSGTGTAEAKFFPAPGFVPSLGIIRVTPAAATLAAVIPLKVSALAPASGLPLPPSRAGSSGEVPLLDTLQFDPDGKARFSEHGIDSEALAWDAGRQSLWISDEYGPCLVQADPVTGLLLQRYAPGSGLPAVLAKRRPNRGMEGMCIDAETGLLHAFLQSPLSDGSALYAPSGRLEKVERHARFVRWIEFDPGSGATRRMLAYPLAGDDYHQGRTGNAKLGDVAALGQGRFVVIEQGEGRDGKMFNHLVLADTGQASALPDTADLERSSMSGSPVNGSDWAQVVPMKKTRLLDLNAAGWLAEKAEGLALVDAHTLAVASDNDFGLKTRVLDLQGLPVPAADVTQWQADAAGRLPGYEVYIGQADEENRPSRIWLLRFDAPIASYMA